MASRPKGVHSRPPSDPSSDESELPPAAQLRKSTGANKKKKPELQFSDFNKASFRKWRSELSYGADQDDPKFFCTEMAWLYREVYLKFSSKAPVCPMRWINFDKLMKKADYFGGAVQVCRVLGLEHLMETECSYNVSIIHQFYATVVFDNSEDIGMTWMTGTQRLTSSFREFARILGCSFSGSSVAAGERMHLQGVAYNKNVMSDLYMPGGEIGSQHGLLPTYDILLRMFRHTIAPIAGNADNIAGGLVNLMAKAHEAFVGEYELDKEEYKIDIMDFIFQEMSQAIFERKVPPYAPYVMLLIKRKYQLSEEDGGDMDSALGCIPHTAANLVQKKAHVVQKQATLQEIDEDDVFGGPTRQPRRHNIKKAEKKSCPWIVQAMEKVLNMNCCIHSENYAIYQQNHRILKQQEEIRAHLQMPPPKRPLRPIVPYAEWNSEDSVGFTWDTIVPEDIEVDPAADDVEEEEHSSDSDS